MKALRDRWTPTSRLHDRSDEGHPEKRILDCSIGWQNYQDQYGDFWPAEPGYSEPDGDGFQARFTRIPRLIRLGEDGKKRAYPVPGNDQVWIQLSKPEELTLGTPTSKQGGVWTWDRDAYTFYLIVSASGVKFKLVLKRPVGTNTLHIPFESQGLQRQGRNLLHDGEVVARLRRPSVRHPGMSELDEPIPVDVRFESGVIVLEFDPTGMQYPVVIDPPLDLQVGASENDAREKEDDGAVSITATNCDWYDHDSDPSDRYWPAWRWVTAALSQGDTIDVAYLTLYVPSTDYDDPSGYIHFEAAASPSVFTTTASDITNRSRTSTSAAWSAEGIGTGWKQGPSVVSPLQEVVTAYTPTALVAIGRPAQAADKAFVSRAYDYDDGSLAGYIHIESTAVSARRIFIVA